MRSENALEGWFLIAAIAFLSLRNALTILLFLAVDSKARHTDSRNRTGKAGQNGPIRVTYGDITAAFKEGGFKENRRNGSGSIGLVS